VGVQPGWRQRAQTMVKASLEVVYCDSIVIVIVIDQRSAHAAACSAADVQPCHVKANQRTSSPRTLTTCKFRTSLKGPLGCASGGYAIRDAQCLRTRQKQREGEERRTKRQCWKERYRRREGEVEEKLECRIACAALGDWSDLSDFESER
jgi:hypothetical protein